MKTYPNKERYNEILRGMTAQQKLEKAFELGELADEAFKAGLRQRNPQLSTDELERLYVEKRRAWHNQDY